MRINIVLFSVILLFLNVACDRNSNNEKNTQEASNILKKIKKEQYKTCLEFIDKNYCDDFVQKISQKMDDNDLEILLKEYKQKLKVGMINKVKNKK